MAIGYELSLTGQGLKCLTRLILVLNFKYFKFFLKAVINYEIQCCR